MVPKWLFVEYQPRVEDVLDEDHDPVGHVVLDVLRDLDGTGRDGPRTVGPGSDEVDLHGDRHLADQIREEDERTGQDPDHERGLPGIIRGDLRGDALHGGSDLFLAEAGFEFHGTILRHRGGRVRSAPQFR